MSYLALRKNGNLKKYLTYYPEDRHKFNEYREMFRQIVDELYETYQTVYVQKLMDKKDIKYQLRPLIYDIHKNYLETKKPTNFTAVKNYFHDLPVKKIQFVMNYY